MKIRNYLLFLIIGALSACMSDSQDNTAAEGDGLDSISMSEIYSEPQPELPEPERDEALRKLDEEKTRNSPFFSKGCCKEEDKRLSSCCCDEVFREYEKMYKSNAKGLVKINAEDPLFNGCREDAAFLKKLEGLTVAEEEEY